EINQTTPLNNQTTQDNIRSHPIANADAASEIELIREAAPTVDSLINELVAVFGDLRKAFDEGSVTYPYSLRELLNIVGHISAFPQDSLGQLFHGLDATDFNNDAYTSATKLNLQMQQVASKNIIPALTALIQSARSITPTIGDSAIQSHVETLIQQTSSDLESVKKSAQM
ncbi:hypothetical protein HDU80_004000, partial [Chytriomyces hyalinus]